jgi:predicted amidohydrolase YtcJ
MGTWPVPVAEDPMLACLVALTLSALPPADVIYTDGDIVTMAEGKGAPEALAVLNGRIAAVGSKAEVMRLRGPATRVVKLGTRALLPAFIDPHSHFLAAAAVQGLANVSLPPVGTVRSILDILSILRATPSPPRGPRP